MGTCCCKEDPDEIGETEHLVDPVSGIDDVQLPRGGSYGTQSVHCDPHGVQQADMNAAVTQILESVAVQVIDVAGAHAAAPAMEQRDYLQRSRAFHRAIGGELAGRGPRRRLPNASSTTPLTTALTVGLGAEDLQFLANSAQIAASAIAELNVRLPSDLLVQFGVSGLP